MSKAHWLGLSTLSGVGGATFRKLIDCFGTAEAVFAADAEALLAVPRITPKIVAALGQINLSQLASEIAALEAAGIAVLSWNDAAYPSQLQTIATTPPILYVQGSFSPADARAVAIVGTREPTKTAVHITQTLAQALATRGLTIVSGLALGIDTAAHEGALLAENGRTLAVLGSGLQAIHPRQNIPLATQIRQRGVILSEYRPRTRVKGRQLMARDRLISGLSRAVIVVEANENSGSLDTAQKAQRQNRLLFAIPGSPGTDALLKQGVEALDPDTIKYDAFVARLLAAPEPSTGQQLSLL